jgi:hypothetical protein
MTQKIESPDLPGRFMISLEGDGEALASLRLQLEPSIRDGSAAFCRLILKAKLWMSSRSVSIA